MLGVFAGGGPFLFFFFWEMMLNYHVLPCRALGTRSPTAESRISTATKFFIYPGERPPVVLVAILGLVLTPTPPPGRLRLPYQGLLNFPQAARSSGC